MQLSSAQHDALRRLAGSEENVVGYSGNTITVDREGRMGEAALVYVVDGKQAVPLTDVAGLPVEAMEVGRPVLETGQAPVEPLAPADVPVRPVVAGYSVGVENSASGTLGYFVRDGDDALGVLSNGHVLTPIGGTMVQPSPVRGGTHADAIGTVTASIDVDEEMDAAYGLIDQGIEVEVEVVEIGVLTGTAAAQLNENARKRGVRTGLTTGTVGDVDAYIRVGPPGSPLVNQLRIDGVGLSDGGDSGSVWVNDQAEAIGLHWSGNPAHTRAWAYKIDRVLTRLGVTLA
jgi:hypothetical protein